MEELQKLLKQAGEEKRKPIVKILDTVYAPTAAPADIIKGMKWLSRNIVEDFWRDVFGSQETYRDILVMVCKHLEITVKPSMKPQDIEAKISQQLMQTVWNKMTEAQRLAFDAEMKKMAEKNGKGKEWAATGGMAAVLAASNLAGFSAYLVATSSLAALTGSLGIVLPFAAYTGLTTALSVVLGPVGWLGAGLFALIGLTGANYQKLIPAILYISVLRNEQA